MKDHVEVSCFGRDHSPLVSLWPMHTGQPSQDQPCLAQAGKIAQTSKWTDWSHSLSRETARHWSSNYFDFMVKWFCTRLQRWGAPTPTSNSQTLARCPIVQLNRELASITWRHHQIPQVESSVLQDCPPPYTHQMSLTSQGHLCFWPTCYRLEVPVTLSLSSVNLLEPHTELKETFYLLGYQLIIKVHNSGIARWKRCIE